MEQRRLRLGDILDDYCPRERRVTNHAVVAMIEEDVKQTRCTTCDAEHAYKGARVPQRRKKETPAALYKEVLDSLPEAEQAPALASQVRAQAASSDIPGDIPQQVPAEDLISPAESHSNPPQTEDTHAPMHSNDNEQRDEVVDPPTRVDEGTPGADGPVHRPLIRATLPRPEGQKDARPVPDFTVRHAPSRGNGQGNGQAGYRAERTRMRGGKSFAAGNGNREPNGNRAQNSGQRFHGNRPSGRQPMGRASSPSGFRNGTGGSGGKRGRGSRG